ncbi:unnamed protein product [Ambrosiozyma monospora]|uniref:Unnamed protein product n=1 Tax=Ambrosiozyma monospora TaxID=43982 RepID=A0ACB5TMR8_AMBMO|nr:unnamed protein product [Ambrosiozyma monospora]
MHVHHEGQFITVHRTNAKTGRGYFLIARTKFYPDGDQSLAPITLHGTQIKNDFAYTLSKSSLQPKETITLTKGEKKIEPVHVELTKLKPFEIDYDEKTQNSTISLPEYFPQGSIAVLSTFVKNCDDELDDFLRSGALEAAQNLNLIDINAILYKCESEERDASAGMDGCYDIPNYGHLVYAGIQGFISVLRDVILNNDLAHPIANHLRDGTWALDFIPRRLEKYAKNSEAIKEFQAWLESRFDAVKKVPYFLVPRYFALTIGIAYEALRFQALSLMSPRIQHSTVFVQSLAMCSVQMIGLMNSASIDPFTTIPSMAAGLPHFSYDFMRCWGRDVFISVRGLLLATNRFEEAKQHILRFAMTLKHGLIPNLLGSGKEPRYNARDAVWFFLQCIQDYVHLVPGGESILDEKVKRRFPLDDTYIKFDDPRAFIIEKPMLDHKLIHK